MASSYNEWQYARWVQLIARNSRITLPTGAELTACRTFLKAIWNPVTQTGTREWLQDVLVQKAVTGTYNGNIDNEPSYVIVEMLEAVADNMKQIPITDAEGVLVNTLIAATGNRRYGTSPYYGNEAGSLVTLP